MVTLRQAKVLRRGDMLVDSSGKNWKVTSAAKTWKRNTKRVEVGIKHGLHRYGKLTESNLRRFKIKTGSGREIQYRAKRNLKKGDHVRLTSLKGQYGGKIGAGTLTTKSKGKVVGFWGKNIRVKFSGKGEFVIPPKNLRKVQK